MMTPLPTFFLRPLALLLLAMSLPLTASASPPPLPQDVTEFVARRDKCDHFRGEEPYDDARRAFLSEKTKEFCQGSDELLRKLKAKYRGDKKVMKKLRKYEESIE